MTLDEAIEHAIDESHTEKDRNCANEHRQLAKWLTELKAKDERIAELEAMIEKMKCCENCEYYPPSKCGKSAQYGCLGDGYNDWRLKG